ncbi:hypothetical protein CAEBREN_11469 [Caenorhabditis brenneri]|uniref:DUF7809 domain-containing protein n=1 Tax=Caenorhabditis brenneri TaxID=135651 RepID=G0P0D8_CAEBE|nr:hypothetical protein CAEBREN_11469 [Caenorhabditis brenneri]
MSKHITYVRPDLTTLPAILQEKVIRKFLSFELIPAGWHCQEKSFIENIRSLYKTSNMRVQYYGSPENLERYLFNFINFPGSQQFFQFDDSVFYKTNLSVYHSLGGNTFIYKKDMYELLFEYIPRIHTLPSLQKLAHSLINYYLRAMKRKLTTSHEMIDIDDEFRGYLCRKQRFMEEMMETGRWKLETDKFIFKKLIGTNGNLHYADELDSPSESPRTPKSKLKKKKKGRQQSDDNDYEEHNHLNDGTDIEQESEKRVRLVFRDLPRWIPLDLNMCSLAFFAMDADVEAF